MIRLMNTVADTPLGENGNWEREKNKIRKDLIRMTIIDASKEKMGDNIVDRRNKLKL